MAGWIKGINLGTRLLSFSKLGLIDILLLEHVGLSHVLDIAVHLVNFWLDESKCHSKPLLLLALFYQSTPSGLKVRVGGRSCDFSVSLSPFGLDFGTLDFELRLDKKTSF